MTRAISFIAGLLLFSAVASAQYGDFTLTGGYSHIYPNRTGGLFLNKDGAYVDGNFAVRLPGSPLPVYAGFGISASGYWDSESYPLFVNNNNGYYNNNLDSDVELIELEPRLAVQLWIPGARGLFIRPQIGAGLLVDNYAVDTAQPVGNVTYFNTLYHTGAAFEVHPDVEAGYSWGPGSVGADFSYMAGWGGFGQLGDSIQEFRAGVFFRFRY